MTTDRNEYDDIIANPAAPKPATDARTTKEHLYGAVAYTSQPWNEYDSILQDDRHAARMLRDEQRLRASMVGAVGTNADRYGEATQLGRRTNLPAQVVERNFDAVHRNAKLNEYDDLVSSAPATARALIDGDTAKLAHDDVANMTLTEKLVSALKRGYIGLEQGAAGTGLGANARALENVRSIEQRLAAGEEPAAIPDGDDLFGIRWLPAGEREQFKQRFAAPVTRQVNEVAQLEADRRAEPTDPIVAAGMNAKTFGEFWHAFKQKPIEFILTVGAESLPQSAPSLVAGGAAGIATRSLAVAAGVRGAGSGATDYSATVLGAMRDEGVDLNNPQAIRAAVNNPELMKRIGRRAFAHAAVVGAFDAASGGLAAVTLAPRRVISAVGRQAISVTAQMPVQGTLGAAGEALGSTAAGQEVTAGSVMSEFFGEFVGAPAEVVTMAASRVRAKAQAAQQAQHAAPMLEQLNTLAKASKLRARDPETFAAVAKGIAVESPIESVYISADALAQSGVDVQLLASVSPAVAAQLDEVQAGQGIAITLAEYISEVAPTEYAQALVPHIRTDANGLSQAEAEIFLQGDAADALRAEVEALAPTQQEQQPASGSSIVREQVLQQLTQANRFTPDVNGAYADLTAAFYTSMADRMGVTPEALAEQIPLNVVSSLAVNLATSFNTQTAQPEVNGPSPAIPHQATSALPASQEALDQSTTLDQAQDGRRGAYDVPSRTIALLDKADLSTFIHESGHFYLEALTELAARPEAPADVQADIQAVMQWFGVTDLAQWKGMTLEAKRPLHEKFARGFEAYTFEGQAPSLELQSVFARFRGWLLRVYQNIKNLNVDLTPEVRGVFDRMLATKSEIATAEAVRGFVPLFKSVESASMTPEQFAEYQRLGRDATTDATAQLERRSLRDMRWLANTKTRATRELQRDANEKRKAVEAEVRAEVYEDPVHGTRHILSRGELPGGRPLPEGMSAVKLDIAALTEIYGGNGDPYALLDWSKLAEGGPHRIASKTNGVHPDAVAEMFGFSSGDHLVRSLLEAQPTREVIEGKTDQRMLERYGDLSSPEEIERAAEAAIHNDVRGRFIERELNALAKATGNKPVLARAARMFAEETIARKRVRDIRPAQYTAAESKASRNADAAFKKGDTATAAAEKRNQLLSHQLARVAVESSAEAVKLTNYLRKFNAAGTRVAIGPEYMEQIDQQLERIDLRASVTNKQADKRKSLAEFIEAQREMGFEPTIDERLIADANRTPARELTLEQLRGIADTVKNIEHLGRLKNKLLTAKDEREFGAAAQDMIESIVANGGEPKPVKIEQGALDQTLAGIANVFGMHRKIASLARQLDGVKDAGAVWQRIVRPMNEAGDKESVMREQATIELGKIFAELNKTNRRERKSKLYIPEINTSLSRDARIAVALNTGNELNRQRLRDGDGWTDAQIGAVTATLTPQENAFVKSVWAYLDSFWPEIAAKEERVTGLAPEKVEGSYYPIKYDSNRSSRSEADNRGELIKQAMQGLYTRATTRRGHTKARVEEVTGRPVRKDLGVIFEHITQVTHDLAWHEYLIDANRLLRHKGVDAAVRNHHGAEVLRQMRDTLEALAVGDVPAQNSFQRSINHVRTGATIAGLGWNVVTSMLQPFGLTQSMVRIGPKWVARGMAQWVGDSARMENTARMIYGKSDMMRLRGKTMQREINEIRNTVSGDGKVKTVLHASYFYLIQKMQLVADIPTWLGQYEKSLSNGVDDATAIAQADQAVLDSQGGGQIKDLSALQRGSPYLKLWTNFYSFFNTTFNLTAESYARTHFRNPLEAGRFMVDMLLLYTVPAVLASMMKAAVKGEDLEDDELAEKLAREQVNYLLGTMVGVRELSAAVSGVFGYSGPAGTRFFSEVTKLGKQVGDGEVDDGLVDALNGVGGVLFHYPAGQIERGYRGLMESDVRAMLFGPARQ